MGVLGACGSRMGLANGLGAGSRRQLGCRGQAPPPAGALAPLTLPPLPWAPLHPFCRILRHPRDQALHLLLRRRRGRAAVQERMRGLVSACRNGPHPHGKKRQQRAAGAEQAAKVSSWEQPRCQARTAAWPQRPPVKHASRGRPPHGQQACRGRRGPPAGRGHPAPRSGKSGVGVGLSGQVGGWLARLCVCGGGGGAGALHTSCTAIHPTIQVAIQLSRQQQPGLLPRLRCVPRLAHQQVDGIVAGCLIPREANHGGVIPVEAGGGCRGRERGRADSKAASGRHE